MTHEVAPMVTAHRGYKAKCAENTLTAFRAAVEAGVDCIETDIQTTSDGICVINHDPHTGRVYDEYLTIGETELSALQLLNNKQDPKSKMITLQQFFEWAYNESPATTKIMLDIKISNPTVVLCKIIRDMLNVNPDIEYWQKRIIFGLWQISFYKLGVESSLLRGFEIINITISPTIAKEFLLYSKSLPKEYQLKGVSFLTMATYTPEFKTLKEELMDPYGIDLHLWTLNSDEDFSLGMKLGCKGFITDKLAEAKVAVSEHLSGKRKADFEVPSIFTLAGFKLMLRFRLYRFFEWIVLHGFVRYKLVQLMMVYTVGMIAKGQK